MTILIKSIKTKFLIKKILNKNKNNMLVITSFLTLLFSLILIDINFETNSANSFGLDKFLFFNYSTRNNNVNIKIY